LPYSRCPQNKQRPGKRYIQKAVDRLQKKKKNENKERQKKMDENKYQVKDTWEEELIDFEKKRE
jgi:hypothetical protein